MSWWLTSLFLKPIRVFFYILCPFFRNIFVRENCLNRTGRNTCTAVNTFIRVDIQLRLSGKCFLVLAGMDTINRTHIYTCGIFCSDARFSDSVCHALSSNSFKNLNISNLSPSSMSQMLNLPLPIGENSHNLFVIYRFICKIKSALRLHFLSCTHKRSESSTRQCAANADPLHANFR